MPSFSQWINEQFYPARNNQTAVCELTVVVKRDERKASEVSNKMHNQNEIMREMSLNFQISEGAGLKQQ